MLWLTAEDVHPAGGTRGQTIGLSFFGPLLALILTYKLSIPRRNC